jgi:hypothetical protein
MDRAVSFYRDTLGLTLKFASPGRTEFATGEFVDSESARCSLSG